MNLNNIPLDMLLLNLFNNNTIKYSTLSYILLKNKKVSLN